MTDRYVKRLVYAGGLVLVVSFVAGAMLGRTEQPASSVAAEPELFSFIRDFPEVAGKPVDDNAGTPDPVRNALPGLRQVFDAVLSLHADAPADVARMHAESELKARFATELFVPGMAMFDRYARYQRESAPVHAQVDAAADLSALRLHLRSLDMLRARYFTRHELSGLFPNDAAYERMLVAQMTIRENPALGEEQRFAQLQALEASIPAEVRAAEDLRSRVVRAGMQATAVAVEGEDDVYRMNPAGAR